MSQFRALLLLGSAVVLAACTGATDVASPGDGVIVVPAPTAPPPPPPPPPPPGPTPPTANPDCPVGTNNIGLVTSGGTEFRNCQITGTIVGNLLIPFRAGTLYSISGEVNVGRDVGGAGTAPNGVQGILSIEPGVVLFGSSGADFLVVNRGSRLNAEGTATRPIIFTSRSNIEGASGPDSIGQWGGIVILGRAPINNCIGAGVVGGSVDCESIVEGPAAARYGGGTVNDSSGSLRFVQVRYPGFEVTPGNELNGITLAGVGNATGFENVQVHNSSDDGLEWFGGRVNGRFLVLTGIDDDALDTDFGYKGVNQFALVVQRSTGGDRSIEADTAGNDLRTPRSNPLFANLTIIHNRAPAAVLQRGGTDFRIFNSIIRSTNAASACVQMANAFTINPADPALDKVGPPVYRSTFLSCGAGAAAAGSGITVAQIEAVLTGNNNVLTGTSTLTGTWFPGANELAVTPTAVSSVNILLQNTTYIGAFRDANDTWYNGWTCGLGGTTPACTAAPRPAGS